MKTSYEIYSQFLNEVDLQCLDHFFGQAVGDEADGQIWSEVWNQVRQVDDRAYDQLHDQVLEEIDENS